MEVEMSGFARISHHEDAIVCSYETVVDFPLDTIRPRLEMLINKVQRFVDNQGGLVGHIKAYVEEEDRAITLSATGGAVSVTPGCSEKTSINFTAIVFSVDEQKLKSLVEQSFDHLYIQILNDL